MNASSIRRSSIPRLAAAGLAVTLVLGFPQSASSAQTPVARAAEIVEASDPVTLPAALPTPSTPEPIAASAIRGIVEIPTTPGTPQGSSGPSNPADASAQMSMSAPSQQMGSQCFGQTADGVCIRLDPDPPSATTPTAPVQATGPVPSGPVGVPPGTVLTVHNGDLTITTPGTVVTGMDVRGFIFVKAANVTIRNSVVRGRASSTPVALVNVIVAGSSAQIVDSSLVATTASPNVDGVRGSNFSLTRVEIANVIDHVHVYGVGNVLIENSWLHSNTHYVNDPNWNGGPTHDDNIQIQSGSNITITGSTLVGSHNAAIMLTQDAGAVSDVTLSHNWLDEGACTVNIKSTATPPQRVTLRDNTFGRNSVYWNCGIKVATTIPLTLTRNYFTDGAVVGRTP